jgi:hypothetical protein
MLRVMWKPKPEAGDATGAAHAPKRKEIESCRDRNRNRNRNRVREAHQCIDYEV